MTHPSSVVELIRGPASDAYIQNPRDLARSVQGKLNALPERDGCIRFYHSLEHEDAGKAVVAIVWQAQKQKETAVRALADEFFAAAARAESVHFVPEMDPVPAMDAPATEITMWRVHERANLARAVECTDAVLRFILALPESVGFLALAKGAIREDGRLMQTLGWESVDAHMASVQRYPDAMEMVGECIRLASLEIWHAHFQRL